MTEMPQPAHADLPARAAYAAHHHLSPEEAAAEWPFTPDREREHEHWRTVARAAVAAYIEVNGSLTAALATAVDMLERVALGTDDRLAALAGEALAKVDKLAEDAAAVDPAMVRTLLPPAIDDRDVTETREYVATRAGGYVTASLVRRHVSGVGYGRAAVLLARLARAGVIAGPDERARYAVPGKTAISGGSG
jgi:hypothetical protein